MRTPENSASYDATKKTKFSSSHRKEKSSMEFESWSVVDMDQDPYENSREIYGKIELRLFHTDARATACLWINCGDKFHTQGSGSAGGCGYHRGSAAADEAIRNAGLTLAKVIDGCGNSAITDALLAIAALAGIKRPGILHAHP